MTSSRISELSSIITASTSKLDNFLESHQQPSLSFDADVLPHLQSHNDFVSAQNAAIEACTELLDLLRGSFSLLTHLTAHETVNIQALCHFNLVTNFPKDRETTTYEELATVSGLSEPETRRFMRGAMATRVFREKESGLISHTAASKLLATNSLVRQWVGMAAGEMLPALSRVVDAAAKWPGSEEPTHCGYNYAHNTTEPCFKYMAMTPGRQERFADSMSFYSLDPGLSPQWLVDNGPWNYTNGGDHKKQVIVDIGGSQGTYSIPIAQKFPNISCVVQDLSGGSDPARVVLPSEVKDRISFQEHDFFMEQPVKHADFYLLRWILHDWPDEYAVRILQALIPALKPGARVVVHEYILPEPGKIRNSEERMLRIFDMLMRSLMNGKEREAQDWHALFNKADKRFKVENIFIPPGSKLGIIDVVWDAE